MRILAMWLLAALPLLAQIGGSGSIQGVVADPTGAVVPGASVVANNVAVSVAGARPPVTAAALDPAVLFADVERWKLLAGP